MSVWLAFLTGLTTGGISCLAMQGGLLASVISNHKQALGQSPTNPPGTNSILSSEDWLPVTMFLLTKLVAHTLLGFLLGWLGSAITLSLGVRLLFQVFTAVFMLATALNLLQVHPIFRYVSFRPPKFLQRLVRQTSKSQALFAPALLGVLTIFVPCGVTQAMEVVAINSGHPVTGALLMMAFVLGTSPLFAVLGVATARLATHWYERFNRVAAYLLIVMAILGFNGVLQVLDAPITLQKMASPVLYFFSDERFKPSGLSGLAAQQQVNIQVTSHGYSPSRFRVRQGQPVTLTLQSRDAYSCAADFVFKEFGIHLFLQANDTQTVTFTPTKKGNFTYSCSMGMYSGVMEVL